MRIIDAKGIVPQSYLDALPHTRWAPFLAQRAGDVLVALLDGTPVGTSCVGSARDEVLPGWGEIVSLYLLPAYLGEGPGSSLLRAAVEELLRRGYPKVYLWVLEDNARVRAFYEKNGFRATADQAVLEIEGNALTEIRYIFP